jgi:hypothetical protein
MRDVIIIAILIMLSKTCLGQIFAHDTVIEYGIEYFQSKNQLKTEESIFLTITGRKWEKDKSQSEVIWTYHSRPETRRKFQDQFSIGWFSTDTTGVIENETKVWLHPPRHNQYSLTEIAPFPDFRKNLTKGDTYSSILYTGSGFGVWDGRKIKSIYLVEDVRIEHGDTLWTISAKSALNEDTNSCVFVFSLKKGFIALDYRFFDGDTMTMKMKKDH